MNEGTVVLRLSDKLAPGSATFEAKFLVEEIESFDDFTLTLKNGRTVYPVLAKDAIARKIELSATGGDLQR